MPDCPKIRGGSSWTTQDELAFIEGLGTYNLGSENTPRTVWLADYIATLGLRQEWQSMDCAIVTDAAATAYQLATQTGA